MNPNYIHTVTIFNCLRGKDNPTKKDIWQKTILRNCYYKNVIGRVEDGKTARMSNVYTARIPMSDQYLPHQEWIKKKDSEREQYFTFSLDDIVIYGECMETISGSPPNTAAEVLKRHKPDAFVITAFSDNTSHEHSKHYRVGG